MRRHDFQCKVFFCAILALACGPDAARAGFNTSVAVNETALSGGLYLYSYTVTDLKSSTVAISEFDVAVNDPIGLKSIISPNDFFTFYNPGDSLITFTAFDDGIIPGSSGVFSFISTSAPGLVADIVFGNDSSTGNLASSPGTILGPVPEPSSLLMCGLGAVGVLGMVARSRRRQVA